MNKTDVLGTIRDLANGLAGAVAPQPPKTRRAGAVCRGRLEAVACVADGAFRFSLHVIPGTDYVIETSADLVMWRPIAEGVAAEPVTEFVDTLARNRACLFYRSFTGLMSSVNIIGFVHRLLAPGLSMVSNPLYSPSNEIGSLLRGLPDGTALSKYDPAAQRLVRQLMNRGRWANPDETLSPGEGCVIENPTGNPEPVTFLGEVCQGNLCNPVPGGSSIRSSMVPQAGELDAALAFPVAEGDTINLLDPVDQRYEAHRFEGGAWSPSPPVVDVGDAFWVQKRSGAVWMRNFLMN